MRTSANPPASDHIVSSNTWIVMLGTEAEGKSDYRKKVWAVASYDSWCFYLTR